MASYILARLLSLTSASASSPPSSLPSAAPPRILVLISGSGTNLQALIDAPLQGVITHVLSNRKTAYGLTRAKNAGIATSYHNLLPYKPRFPGNLEAARAAYDADLANLILAENPDLVVCAGWMHILSAAALDPLRAAGIDIINLHPALPGCFDGKDAIARAWTAFQAGKITETGVMIHHVITDVDRGEPILVRRVPLTEGESVEELEARIHKIEHGAIVEGTRMVLQKRRARQAASQKET